MSSDFQQHFTADNLSMLARILDHAGVYQSANDQHLDLWPTCARYLIKAFQAGVVDEHELCTSLSGNLVRLNLRQAAQESVPLRIFSTSNVLIVGTRNGYRFGGAVTRRRVSLDNRMFGKHFGCRPPMGWTIVKSMEISGLPRSNCP